MIIVVIIRTRELYAVIIDANEPDEGEESRAVLAEPVIVTGPWIKVGQPEKKNIFMFSIFKKEKLNKKSFIYSTMCSFYDRN